MRNSYGRGRERSSARRLLTISTVFALLLFVGDFLSHGTVRGLVRSEVGAVWSAAGSSTQSGNVAGLEARVAQLENERSQWLATSDENQTLKSMVHLARTSSGISAPIVSRGDTNPFGTFVIGIGSLDGATLNAVVVAPDGFVLGRISEVDAHTSLVRELFAPDLTIAATLKSAAIQLQGRGAGNARGQLPREATTTPGEVIRSAVVGNRPIGVVGAIVPDPGNAFQEVYVRTPDAVDALRIVYVIP